MKPKRYFIAAFITFSALVFSGCASKGIPPTGSYHEGKNERGDVYTILANAPEASMFTPSASYLNSVIAYPLQIAAEDTLASGHKFFSIIKPAELSNVDGIMVNSANEYLEKCANNNVLKGLLVLTNPCKVAYGPLERPFGGRLMIQMYDTKPQDHLAYDAAQVLEELKAKNAYYDKPRFKGKGEWNKDKNLKFMDLESKK
jgi:hypothetical protein